MVWLLAHKSWIFFARNFGFFVHSGQLFMHDFDAPLSIRQVKFLPLIYTNILINLSFENLALGIKKIGTCSNSQFVLEYCCAAAITDLGTCDICSCLYLHGVKLQVDVKCLIQLPSRAS